MESTFGNAGAQQPLPFRIARENRAGTHQGRRRHHESGRPDEADPFQVGIYVRVAFRNRLRRHEQRNDAPSRLPVDAENGSQDHDRRVVCVHQQSSAMPLSGSTAGILHDSFVENTRIRREVGTSAVHGAD